MESASLFTAILGGGLVSGIVTSIINYYSGRKLRYQEIDIDQRKFILKKRIEAYEKISPLINQLGGKGTIYKVTDNPFLSGTTIVNRMFIENAKTNSTEYFRPEYVEFQSIFFETMKFHWYWYTNDFRKKLANCSALLYNVNDSFKKMQEEHGKEKNDKISVYIGSQYDQELEDVAHELMLQLIKDVPRLHKIKEFKT